MLHTEHGLSWAAMSRKIGRNSRDSTLSQIWHQSPDRKNGRLRQMGNDQARLLEQAFGKPEGWMDRDPDLDSISTAPADLRTAEPDARYAAWPLEGVSPDDFFRLPANARAHIAAIARGAVLMLEDAPESDKRPGTQPPRLDSTSSPNSDAPPQVVIPRRKRA